MIQHVPHEGPGLVLDVLRAAGQRVEFCHPYAGDIVPAAEDLAGLVILGGPMGATDDADYPQLATWFAEVSQRPSMQATVPA